VKDRNRKWLAGRRIRAVALALVVGTLVATAASACPVCYGEVEGGVITGARLAIVFMAVLVYALIGGGIGVFIALRRRALRLQKERDPRRGLRLIHPEPRAVSD